MRQSAILKNIITLSFSIAGCSWFVLWWMNIGEAAPAEEARTFKENQYQIYLILMTLYWLAAQREAKRIGALLEVSTALAKPWHALSSKDLAEHGKASVFDVIAPAAQGYRPAYGAIGFTWLLLICTTGMFARQIILLTQL